jgi:hypothetical protein
VFELADVTSAEDHESTDIKERQKPETETLSNKHGPILVVFPTGYPIIKTKANDEDRICVRLASLL